MCSVCAPFMLYYMTTMSLSLAIRNIALCRQFKKSIYIYIYICLHLFEYKDISKRIANRLLLLLLLLISLNSSQFLCV